MPYIMGMRRSESIKAEDMADLYKLFMVALQKAESLKLTHIEFDLIPSDGFAIQIEKVDDEDKPE